MGLFTGVFDSAIRKVAFEPSFYNIGDCAALDDAVQRAEDSTAPIIHEIRERNSPAAFDERKRGYLAGFTALQLVRTKAYSKRTSDSWKQIAEAIALRTGGKISQKVQSQSGLSSPEREQESVLKTIAALVGPVAERLIDKSLLLYRTDGSLPFWISDNPVVLNNTTNPGDGLRGTLGVGVTGIEIYLPISRELTLAYMCPSIAFAFAALHDQAASMAAASQAVRSGPHVSYHAHALRQGPFPATLLAFLPPTYAFLQPTYPPKRDDDL